jgi:type II secretory pathway component PulJ
MLYVIMHVAMNWLSGLLKIARDYFSTPNGEIVLIVLILTAVVTVVLSHAIPAFGRFLRRLPKSSRRFSQMLRRRYQDWRYLRKYGTRCEFREKGKLQIEELPQSQGYNMTLEFSLEFTNRDNLNKLMIDRKDILVDINSEWVNGQKTHYPLTDVYLVPSVYWIKPTESETVSYKVRCYRETKPWLASTCLCYIKALGNCRLSPASKRLMHKPFAVDVDWSKIETSHKEDLQK